MKPCVLCSHADIQILFDHHKNWKMGKCRACGLVQLTPMPKASEISELYHEDFDHFAPYIEQTTVHQAYFQQKVEEISAVRAEIANENFDPSSVSDKQNTKRMTINESETGQNFVRSSPRKSTRTFLDIGCLTGILLSEAKKKGYGVTGIDISADAVTYCNKQKLKTYNGTVYSVKELKNGTFDVITAFQIIEHERDPVRMMRRIHLLLKKGGMVVLATPDVGGFWSRLMGKDWFGYRHPEHVVLLDFVTMRKLLEKAGFSDIEIRHDSPRPFPLSFAVRRAGDYFPWAAWLLTPIGRLLDRFTVINPINPWDDMIVFARK